MNQGEILNYMTIFTQLKPTKYDIKDIFTKNKITYKTLWDGFKSKKGVEIYTKMQDNVSEEPPF
jgi:hypothetical protein